MRIRTTYRNRTFDLIATNLCHYGDYGDYEVFPSEELDLDLQALAETLAEHGYEIEGSSQKALLLHHNQAVLTVFPTGRMIVENVRPGTYEEAISIGCQMLESSGGARG